MANYQGGKNQTVL